MRQGNGTDLLGMNDPRSATIGVIYVSAVDDRKSVLAAILTQENLNRQQIVIVLPNPNNAFQRQQDFDDLKSVQRKRKLQGEIIFVAPNGPGPAEFARQRRFHVYDSLEDYTEALRDGEIDDLPDAEPEQVPEKKNRFFGGWMKSAEVGAAAGAAGAAAAHQEQPDEPQSTMIFPGYTANQQPGASARQAPSSKGVPSTPRIPTTPNRGTLDDDDDLGDAPITPPTGRSGMAGAAALGAGAGLSAEHLRKSPMIGQSGHLDDDDEIETMPSRGLPADNVVRSPRASNPLAQNPNTAQNSSNPGPGGPGIIDLQPLTPKGSGRIPGSTGTGKLNEPPVSTPIPDNLDAEENFAPPPPTHGARRRRTGSMATGAAVAGAAGTGAFAAIGAPNSGPHAAAAGNTGSMTPIQYPSNRSVPPQRLNRTGQKRRRGVFILLLLLIFLLLFLLIIGAFAYNYLNPAGFQSNIARPISHIIPASAQTSPVTVTITPKSQVVSDTYVIQAVTSSPNADLQQVSLKNLSATPDPQTQTVTGTGHTQTNPTQATGTVTFFNIGTTSERVTPTTFPALTNGDIIVTDATVVVPPASFDADNQLVTGQQVVAAHIKNAGSIGNIATKTFNYSNCCGANLRAENLAPFTGGQDSKNYTFIQQSDVDAVVNPLVNTLAQEAKTQFNTQLTANESLVGSPSCPNPQVDDDPGAIGDKGHSITSMTVKVTATCTGIAYDRSGAQKVAQQRLQKKANTTPGKGYVLSGAITSKIINVSKQQNSASLQVQAQGTWNYQVTDAQKAALVKELAGKKIADAQAILNAQPGFQNASIKSDGNNSTLPTDATQIKIDVPPVSGSNNGTPTPGDSNPTPSNNPGATPTSTAGRGMVPTEILKG